MYIDICVPNNFNICGRYSPLIILTLSAHLGICTLLVYYYKYCYLYLYLSFSRLIYVSLLVLSTNLLFWALIPPSLYSYCPHFGKRYPFGTFVSIILKLAFKDAILRANMFPLKNLLYISTGFLKTSYIQLKT